MDVADLGAVELADCFRKGELSPVEAATACLERIHRYDGEVNAFCLVDEEVTLRQARESESRYRQGQPRGPIDGVPVAIKDVFLTRGWPTRKGSRTIDPQQPWTVDAPAVAALRRHGAVAVGKTTTPEFGWKGVTDNPVDGITRNPWDPRLTSGGSSGGSGVAVSLGMAALALGTDAGGSIRIPAGFCGIVGFKPTRGRAPMWPGSPFGALAHPGPMTRTVQDCAVLLRVMTEPDPRDTTLPPDGTDFGKGLDDGIAGLPVAFSPDLGYAPVDPAVAAVVKEAVAVLDNLGACVETVDPRFEPHHEAFSRLFYGGAANALRTLSAADRTLMDPELVAAAEAAAQMSVLDYLAAQNTRSRLIEQMAHFHGRFALLVTPTLPITAFTAGIEVPDGWPHRRWHTWSPFTWPFNLTGQPAISVPCGFTPDGLPVGLQIVGPRHADALVLRTARAFERARPMNRRPGLLHS